MLERSTISTSLLQSVADQEHKQLLAQFDSYAVITDLIKGLDEKAKSVVSARAGLQSGKKITLSQIGEQFHLSRERIRQIERDVLRKLSDALYANHKKTAQMIVSTIEAEGGIVAEENLVALMLNDTHSAPRDVNAFRLLLRLTRDIVEIKDTKTVRTGWMLRTLDKKVIDDILGLVHDFIHQSGKVVSFDAIWDAIKEYESYGKKCVEHTISLSKEIIRTTDDKYGLATWPTVNPRNVRDKIFYVLHQSGSPMHFTDIARSIRDKSFDHKKIVQPTVHNELIADDRFVLVGRGIYALSHWGYKPGTVEDVIEEVLRKSKKPLTTDEIVEEVLKSRQVKKNTIIINLQIKPQFVKVGKKLYTVSVKETNKVSQDVKETISVAEKN